MPTINPSLVPSITAGNLFDRITYESTYNIRWLQPNDPVYFEVLNRPHADIALRQLIIAKTLDQLAVGIGRQTMFPFIVQAKITDGSTETSVPQAWIWDASMSAPDKWTNLRLAKIKRISGANLLDSYTGEVRLIFTANVVGSATEVALFYADYEIDSDLTYQRVALNAVTTSEESVAISSSESGTIGGYITFRTLDIEEEEVSTFFDMLDPSSNTADANSDGYYDDPLTREIVNTIAGGSGVTDDFSESATTHGTGLLLDSVYNPIPPISSSIESWVAAFNFPFDASANRISSSSVSIEIPVGLFDEFVLIAPGSDLTTGSTSAGYFPVWISRIDKTEDSSGNITLTFVFATRTTALDSSNVDTIEFASLSLEQDDAAGSVIAITETDNLKLESGTYADLFKQGFVGHVVLSSLWGNTSSVVDTFFASFDSVGVTSVAYSYSATRLSSLATHRVPVYTPTAGQAQALTGTTSDFDSPIPPSSSNKFVTELDEGTGNEVDLEAISGISSAAGVDRYGYTGGRTHKAIKLCIDHSLINGDDDDFYNDQILPRLRALFGRDPIDFDMWWNGTRIMQYIDGAWVG